MDLHKVVAACSSLHWVCSLLKALCKQKIFWKRIFFSCIRILLLELLLLKRKKYVFPILPRRRLNYLLFTGLKIGRNSIFTNFIRSHDPFPFSFFYLFIHVFSFSVVIKSTVAFKLCFVSFTTALAQNKHFAIQTITVCLRVVVERASDLARRELMMIQFLVSMMSEVLED